MKINEALNAIKDLFVQFANDNNIDLKKEFGTPDAFKQFVIAFTFRTLTENGLTTEEAYNTIFGDDAYEALFADLYTAAIKKVQS